MVFLSKCRVDSTLPCLFPLILTVTKNFLESCLHLIIPLCAHSICLDPLPLKHVSNVALNFESNSIGSVFIHSLHILKIGKLNAWNWFIAWEISVTVSVSQEWSPQTVIIDIVINKSWVIISLNVGPYVFRIKYTPNGL